MDLQKKYNPENVIASCLNLQKNYQEIYSSLYSSDASDLWDSNWHCAHLKYLHSLHDRLKHLSDETEKIKIKIEETKKKQ